MNMKKFYLVIEVSGHCNAMTCYGVEVLSEEEWEELEKRMKERIKNSIEDKCPDCGMTFAEMTKRYIVDDCVLAKDYQEAEQLFKERTSQRFRIDEYPDWTEVLRKYYTR